MWKDSEIMSIYVMAQLIKQLIEKDQNILKSKNTTSLFS